MNDTAAVPEMPDKADPPNPVSSPILNSPYQPPSRHWELNQKTFRMTEEVLEGRRKSGAYLPVPVHSDANPDPQSSENTEPHLLINHIREEVDKWHADGWPGVSRITRRLLDHWSGTETQPQLFYGQKEAVETAIWLLEAGPKIGGKEFAEIATQLHEVNEQRNEGIARVAIKMATGAGKTIVMALLIAWQALNSRRRTDFLVITPNLTVKERLAELHPTATKKLYADLLPPDLQRKMGRTRVSILNFQACQKRDQLGIAGEGDSASGNVKKLLRRRAKNDPESWKETDRQMLERLLKQHRGGGKIIVLNDESHHCYAPVPAGKSSREDKEYEESAALWFNMLRSLKTANRLGPVFDLSATPMYLRKPADLESVIFPWTISDYPLIEAVEAGITKIPRIPTEDDTDQANPVYRDLYGNIRQKKLQFDNLPMDVTTLLEQMHEHYRDKVKPLYADAGIHPVFIVVANTVENATTLYKHIAGYQDADDNWHEGSYNSFSNVQPDGVGPLAKAPTVLVHSALDTPEQITGIITSIVKQQREIHSPEAESNQEAIARIRAIFNSVGQPGKPGEHIRCVISVSMLTEGWDAKNVTHIVGYRAFKSQLLCEQVCGRALRRTSFEMRPGRITLDPEYANIYGVPFDFMRASEEIPNPPALLPYDVRTVPGREQYRIAFPNLAAYVIELPSAKCHLNPDKVEPFFVDVPSSIPFETVVEWYTGEKDRTTLKEMRRQAIIYEIAKVATTLFVKDKDNPLNRRRALFACMLKAVDEWLRHPKVIYKDLRRLLYVPFGEKVPALIAKACVDDRGNEPRTLPVFADERDPAQSRSIDTSSVHFQTTVTPVHECSRSELNKAPCDSIPEVRVAQVLDKHTAITNWARNFRLGWQIPYLDKRNGYWRSYFPDFVARVRSHGDPLHLVIEFKGMSGEDSDTKKKYVKNWWLPAVNNSDDDSCKGEWRYVFINDEHSILETLNRAIRK